MIGNLPREWVFAGIGAGLGARLSSGSALGAALGAVAGLYLAGSPELQAALGGAARQAVGALPPGSPGHGGRVVAEVPGGQVLDFTGGSRG